MSVPPQLIHVKRKADEELPVSYLRVQETKRHRSDAFVYQRQVKGVKPKPSSTLNRKPIIHTSSPSRQVAAFQSNARESTFPNEVAPEDKDNTTVMPVADRNTNTLDSASVAEPRQFHMSRRDMMLATSLRPGLSLGEVSKKRPATALFVERKIKRISSKAVEKFHAANSASAAALPFTHPPEAEAMEVDEPEPKKFKKPGVARIAARNNTSKEKPELPKSMMNRWNADMQQLTADMEAYAMQQIGLNIQMAEEEKYKQERSKSSGSSKLQFKPKPPAKRYAERHPEEPRQSADQDIMDADIEHSDGDGDGDSDFIIETYVRVPASTMGDHVPPQTVGLLVFDEEPDIEFFYGEDDDSEDDWAEDEEDENAENYYTADYPDEEVATDDEFDENPYAFRTGNASDMEEFDVENESNDPLDDDDDDDDEESVTNQFRTYIGRNGLRSNHL
ncbi:hypothetical protein GGS21DRAFT_475207 [Xylaria nigripes]|nr:hypothetical protein GGS21DRAFT_475207 [Xylaria nigripes]